MGPRTSDADLYQSLKKIIKLIGGSDSIITSASINITDFRIEVSKDCKGELFTVTKTGPEGESRKIEIHLSELPVMQTVMQVLSDPANPQTEIVDLENLPDGFSVKNEECAVYRRNRAATASQLRRSQLTRERDR